METASESNPFFFILISIIVLYSILAFISSWLIQRKSSVHPVRNGFISAAIPSVVFVLIGMAWEFFISPSDPHYTGLFSVIVAALSVILFLIIGLPVCIISCKKLAKSNQANKE